MSLISHKRAVRKARRHETNDNRELDANLSSFGCTRSFRLIVIVAVCVLFAMQYYFVVITPSDQVSSNEILAIFNPRPRLRAVAAPTPSRPLRLLFMLASNSMNQFSSLQKTLDCMRDICNAGWNVTVHMSVSGGFNSQHARYQEIIDRAYCVRAQSNINIIVEEYDDIGFGLNCKHRHFMRAHLDEFDYFSYAEEDMQLTLSHLMAALDALARLKQDFPSNWINYAVGFYRWEDSSIDSERVSWEYQESKVCVSLLESNVDHVGLKIHALHLGSTDYIVSNNLNQAIFVFPKVQVEELQSRF